MKELFSGMTSVLLNKVKLSKRWSGISGMHEIYQHIGNCLKLPPVTSPASVGAVGAAAPQGPLYICIILCAQCNSRHKPTATSLVTAAPRLTTGKRPNCTVQQHWHRSERFGTDFDKWASGASTYSNILLLVTLPVTVVTARLSS